MDSLPKQNEKDVLSKLNYCRLCLTKQDLSEISLEKSNIIKDTLTISLSAAIPYRLCNNCNNAISCFEKFKRNCLKADYVLRCGSDSVMKNTFLTCSTDESLTTAFNTIQNWLTDVGILLRHLDDVLIEKGMVMNSKKVQPVLTELEMEVETLHEEEVFAFDSFDDTFETTVIDEIDEGKEDNEELTSDNDDKEVNDNSRSSFLSDGDLNSDSDDDKKCQKLDFKRPSRTKPKFDETLDISRRLRPKKEKVNLTHENSLPIQDGFSVDDYFDESKVGKKRPYKCALCQKHYCRSEFVYHMNVHWSKYAKNLNFQNHFELIKSKFFYFRNKAFQM